MKKTPAKKRAPRAGRYEVAVIDQRDGTFRVTWPPAEMGQRRCRRVFPSATAANKFADNKRADFTNRGRKVAGLRSSAADDAGEAAALLAPYGISILEAARDFVTRAQARLSSKLVPDAVEAFLDARKADASPRYFGDLRARLNRFSAAFPEHHVSDIAAKDLAAWLANRNRSAIDRGNTRRVLSVFFSWAKLNHLAKVNVVEDVPAPKEPDPKCDTFTPDELRLILAACPDDLLPFVTIQAFAGLRSAEVDRLDWKEIDFRRNMIRVDADKAKTGARRFIPMPPVLQAWLRPHAQLAGKVAPVNVNARLSKFRGELATTKEKAKRVEWRHNALRHSFASYSLAKYEDAPKVALWCGHDVKTLLKHYRDLVAAEDAETWFSIMPDSIEEPNQTIATA